MGSSERSLIAIGQLMLRMMNRFAHGSETVLSPIQRHGVSCAVNARGVFHSTDAALKALKQLEGTDSTTDSDTMSQPNSSTGQQSIGEKADVRSGKHHSICQVDPAVMKQLLRIGAESKFNLIALLNDCSVPYVYKVKYLGIFAVTLSNVGRF